MTLELPFFIRGIIIGLAIAVPVGPVGILCVQRTLALGASCGLISGLGAAVADTIYGFIAALGVTFFSSFLLEHQAAFRLAGAAFLVYIGIKSIIRDPFKKQTSASMALMGYIKVFSSSFVLTLTNPLTILAFISIFASFGLADPKEDYVATALLIVGVFAGASLWWLFLAGLAWRLKEKFTRNTVRWLHRIAGILLLCFAAGVLASIFFLPRAPVSRSGCFPHPQTIPAKIYGNVFCASHRAFNFARHSSFYAWR